MSYMIAVSGKGGVGKTTLSALVVRALAARSRKPVLAVDADPNMCLDAALGVKVGPTIGAIREEAKIFAAKGLAAGVSKQDWLELKIAECLVEAQDFDLVAMGRSEGAGCYCYANNILKNALAKVSTVYPYVVLDNEAGLENLSRRIVQDVNLLLMVTDPSARGMQTILRLHQMTGEMNVKYHKLAVVVNRLRSERLPELAAEVKGLTGADFVVGLPDDPELAELAERGGSVLSASPDNPVAKLVDGLLAQAGL